MSRSIPCTLLLSLSLLGCGGALAPESPLDLADGAGGGPPGTPVPTPDGGSICPSCPEPPDATLSSKDGGEVDAGPDVAFSFTDSGSAATAFQINTAHTGSIDDPTLTPPLYRLWDVDLGAEPAFPIIADGRVYLVTNIGNAFALDEKTGATIWGPVAVGSGGADEGPLPAYDAGRLFALNGDGALTALDAATGTTLWSFQFPIEDGFFDSIPTAYGGILYVPVDGTLYAIDEASGATLWTANIGSGDYSSPAVSSSGVYVSYAGPQVYDIDPLSGGQAWHFSGPAGGGGGETPVLFNDALYVMDVEQPVILNANTGQAMGTFASYRIPAFHGTQGFFVTSNSATDFIEAQDLGAQTTNWTFPNVDGGGPDPHAQPMTSPLVVNGYVYAGFIYFGSSISAVAALDETTGELVWSDDTSADTGDGEDFGTDYSLQAADGMLIVPAMNHVVGYASTPPLGDP
jgi:outer membrane protein assembly factor BamB